MVVGRADAEGIERAKIAKTLRGDPGLATTLSKARTEQKGRIIWAADMDRIKRVVLKHARCHMAYELNEPQLAPAEVLSIKPLGVMSAHERRAFEEDDHLLDVWPEVGSRAMNRLLIAGRDVFTEGWLVVQEGRYSYRVTQFDGNRVTMVSIGMQSGPLIGVQKGPLWRTVSWPEAA